MIAKNNREQGISDVVMAQLTLMVLIDVFVGRKPHLKR